jgi:hypothetical protein|nr:MAG TPA: YopX protein [Caudoviricetes sp.]
MIPEFRAWSRLASRMYVVNGLYFDRGMVQYANNDNAIRFIKLENIILMQSTGFTDDLGEAIFEGDVILWTYWDEFEDSGRAKVIFDKGMFKLLDICTEKEVWNNLSDCIENCNVYLQGNIYENPELLEVEI